MAITARSPEIELLVCPRCKGPLVEADSGLSCPACGVSWPSRGGYPDFLAELDATEELGDGWRERQDEMVGWYAGFVDNQQSLVACLEKEYRSVEANLAGAGGRVLDLGGGMGVTRDFLPAGAEYVNIDPSLDWLELDWTSIERRFPSLAHGMDFVRGVGEKLPFADASFDTVLSLWSLNHTSSAAETIAEAARVLRPGGLLVLVLEDMQPGWKDLARLPARRPRTSLNKLLTATGARPWPVQTDHTELTEAELAEWTAPGFELRRRRWAVGDARAPYLVLELERRR